MAWVSSPPVVLLLWGSCSFPIMTSLHLSPMSWDVPVPSSMRYTSIMMNPSKNVLGIFPPPPLLEEVCASLRDMLDASTIWPSQSPWCNMVVLLQKKDRTLQFCVDIRWLNAQTKKDLYPCPGYKRSWRAWQELHTSPQWIFRVDSGRSTWLQSHNITLHSQLVTWASMNLPSCLSGSVTCPWPSSTWCRIHWESSTWHMESSIWMMWSSLDIWRKSTLSAYVWFLSTFENLICSWSQPSAPSFRLK